MLSNNNNNIELELKNNENSLLFNEIAKNY